MWKSHDDKDGLQGGSAIVDSVDRYPTLFLHQYFPAFSPLAFVHAMWKFL